SRRINSSLFPENIGPTTTSIQPMLPLTMSTRAPCFQFKTQTAVPLRSWCDGGMTRYRLIIKLLVIKWSEGGDDRHAKSLLAVDFVGAQHSPGTLRVADSALFRKLINGEGELRSTQQDLLRQCVRQFQRAGTAEMSLPTITHIGPAFQENAALAVFFDG